MPDIPPYYSETIERIASMPAEEFSRLQSALENAQPRAHGSALAAQIKLDIADLGDIINVLTGMATNLESIPTSVESFANDVATAVAGRKKQFDQAALGKRLVSLLSTKALRVSARAMDLQREYENVFASGRILSDIRPVFNSSGTEPLGAVVMHNLKIMYYGGHGDSQEIFFALDNADLATLKNMLERAELKARSLGRLIDKSGIDFLDSK